MKAALRLMRPQQWSKNVLVFVGVLFGHAWSRSGVLGAAWLGFAAFCLLSSAVYAFNDIMDRERDRNHPVKRLRPLASGAISLQGASGVMLLCLVAGMGLAFVATSGRPWLFAAYVLINIGYSLGLKHVVILDVFMLSAGFMLRLLAGTLGLGIEPSHWLLLCGMLLTLFLGFAKRRAELELLSTQGGSHRRVLEHYSAALLDQMITVVAAGTLVAYSLYTVSPETVAVQGTDKLIYTVPFVLYGMFRYLFLLHRRGAGGDPAVDLIRDPQIGISAIAWLATTVWLLIGAGA